MNVQEEIRRLAYDFYEKSGRVGGMDLEHWLRAEQIVMAKLSAQRTPEAAGADPRRLQSTETATVGGMKSRRGHAVSEEKIETAKPERTIATAASNTAAKRTTKKKSGTKSAGKTKKKKD